MQLQSLFELQASSCSQNYHYYSSTKSAALKEKVKTLLTILLFFILIFLQNYTAFIETLIIFICSPLLFPSSAVPNVLS